MSKRCLIPADGFYEWAISAQDKGRDPCIYSNPVTRHFSFAGLWAHNEKLDITSCTIITAPAGSAMKQLHDRQPVILGPAHYDAWLHPENGYLRTAGFCTILMISFNSTASAAT